MKNEQREMNNAEAAGGASHSSFCVSRFSFFILATGH
jgi:hypothetical protein